jgi:tetratricopeptide (TPR) repeat protein
VKTERPPGLSVCLIVRDEEAFLATALRSVAPVADEIVIVDTGSTDSTIDIARSFGARVFERDWRDDFSWARNEGLAQASFRWILCIDADEELTAESLPALDRIKHLPATQRGFWVRIHSSVDDHGAPGHLVSALVRIIPNDPAIRFRGVIHEQPALDDELTALSGEPSDVELMHRGYELGVVERRGKRERNVALARVAVQGDDRDPFNWYNYASALMIAGDAEEALTGFERAVELLGGEQRAFLPGTLTLLAELYGSHRGDYVLAEQTARRCLTVAPHHPQAYFQLGKALTGQRRFSEARAAHIAAIEHHESATAQFMIDQEVARWKALAEIGRTLILEGRDEEALPWLEKALAREPLATPVRLNYVTACERLARIAASEGRRRDALALFERAAPDSSFAAATAAMLRAGLLHDEHRSGEAAAILDAAIMNAPDNVELLLARAKIAEDTGDDAGCEVALRCAFEIDPRRCTLPLASFYLARKRYREAAEVASQS